MKIWSHKIWFYICVPPALLLGVVLALANRERVRISLDPFSTSDPAISFHMPLFLVIFFAILLGILIGGTAAWFGQGRWRAQARRARSITRTRKEQARPKEPPPVLTGTATRSADSTPALPPTAQSGVP